MHTIPGSRYRLSRIALFLACLSLATASQTGPAAAPGAAQPGDLDPSFGTGGKITGFLFNGRRIILSTVLTLPDGKILSTGSAPALEGNEDWAPPLRRPLSAFALARFDRNGRLDRTFGIGGVTVCATSPRPIGVASLARQRDGRLLVGGWQRGLDRYPKGFVARFLPDGRPDRTFGVGGLASGLADIRIHNLEVQPDGRILAAGFGIECEVIRLLPNGRRDRSFHRNREDLEPLMIGPETSHWLALQPDGKILLAGTTPWFETIWYYWRATLVRLNPDGTLDSSFGNGGWVVSQLDGLNQAHTLAIGPDGKIVVAGTWDANDHGSLAVGRYNADGSPDPTFGQEGWVLTDLGQTYNIALGIAVQADGGVTVLAWSEAVYGADPDYPLVARAYRPDGSVDPGFGSEGVSGIASGVPLAQLAVQPDGRLLVAGRTYEGRLSFLARLIGR